MAVTSGVAVSSTCGVELGRKVAEGATWGSSRGAGVLSGLFTGMTQPTSQVSETTKTKTLVRLFPKVLFRVVFVILSILAPVEINTLSGYGKGDAHGEIPVDQFDLAGDHACPVHDTVIYIE